MWTGTGASSHVVRGMDVLCAPQTISVVVQLFRELACIVGSRMISLERQQ